MKKVMIKISNAAIFARAAVNLLAIAIMFSLSAITLAETFLVSVQEGSPPFVLHFEPLMADIHVGDTVTWIWSDTFAHSVVSGYAGTPDGKFDSGVHRQPHTFSVTFQEVGYFQYYCGVHWRSNPSNVWPAVTVTAPTPTPTPTPGSVSQLLNISTRMQVLTEDNVLIGGFIISGTEPKNVIVRAIGPSLGNFGIPNPLADPTLELNGFDGSVTTNDNWKDDQEAEIEATGLQPTNDAESAILQTLAPGAYTAIVRGANGTTGIGLVEAYDLDQPADSRLANISTRGFIDTGDNVMIGGFIIGPEGLGDATVLVRAIGPSLGNFGVANALQNPTLELFDGNGALLTSNDDWKDDQQGEIEATQLEPTDDRESAILSTLPPGGYTAIVRGALDTTGVGLVEVYDLQ